MSRMEVLDCGRQPARLFRDPGRKHMAETGLLGPPATMCHSLEATVHPPRLRTLGCAHAVSTGDPLRHEGGVPETVVLTVLRDTGLPHIRLVVPALTPLHLSMTNICFLPS